MRRPCGPGRQTGQARVDRAIHCGRSGRSSKGAGAEQAKTRCMTARSSIRGLRPTAGGKAQQFNGHMLQS